MTVIASILSGNPRTAVNSAGGGILNASAALVVANSTLSANSADKGGANYNQNFISGVGSPLIVIGSTLDRGSSDTLAAFGITTDQRGGPRTVDDSALANAFLGDGTDIGAVEVVAPNHAPVAKAKNVTVLAGPGGTATLTLTVKVSLKGNTLIENTATVASASSDPNPANNTATVTSKRNPK